MKGAQVGPFRVVVVRALDGSLHALAGKCLHQGGPLAGGRLYERVLPSPAVGTYEVDATREILKCPWHGYEYDIRTGCTLVDESRRLRKFTVREAGDAIFVEL